MAGHALLQQSDCFICICYKKLQDSPLLSIILRKRYTALHRSHSIWSFYGDFWDNLLFFIPVCIRQKDHTQCLVQSCIFK